MHSQHEIEAGGERSSLLLRRGVPHVFGSRQCAEPFDPGVVLGQPAAKRLARVRQVHGSRCVDEPLTLAGEVEADAVGSGDARVAVGVVTADCVPVLAASECGRRVVAIHAGWRGLVGGVVEAGLGFVGGGAAVAAVGPCLCAEHFEVGPEVAERFRGAGLGAQVTGGSGDRSHVDLRAAVAERLAGLGVGCSVSDACTYCDAERWYSFRREVTHGGAERTGRQWSVIAPVVG